MFFRSFCLSNFFENAKSKKKMKLLLPVPDDLFYVPFEFHFKFTWRPPFPPGHVQEEVSSNVKALESAEALREKQLAEFQADEKVPKVARQEVDGFDGWVVYIKVNCLPNKNLHETHFLSFSNIISQVLEKIKLQKQQHLYSNFQFQCPKHPRLRMKPSAIGRGYQDLAQSATSVDKALDVIGENLRTFWWCQRCRFVFFLRVWERKAPKKSFHEFQQQSFAVEARKIERFGSEFGFGSGFSISGFFQKNWGTNQSSFLQTSKARGPPGNIFLTLAFVAVPRGENFSVKNRSVAMMYVFLKITECRFVDSIEIKLTENCSPIVLPVGAAWW